MAFHTSKCQDISITNKAKPIIGKYQVHDHILEQVNCAKYLGIYIDSKLAFNTLVDAIVKKANSTRAFLARNIPRCCRKVKQMAYTTYIRPTVECASPVWDPHTKRNINKSEMVQRRCARYVTCNFDRTSSVTSLLNYLIWPTLEERRHQYRLAVMHRIPMNAHVSNIYRTCYFELRRLASIRRFLTSIATATLVSAFALSRIDYCNSLLFGSTHDVTSHLQRIQNYAARVILRLPKSSSITIHLKSLHWLPVKIA